MIVTDFRLVIKGAAFDEDKYVREGDGKWRISHTGYVRIYELTQSFDDLPDWKLTANRWAAELCQRFPGRAC